MSWNNVVNNSNHPWSLNSSNVDINEQNDIQLAYELHNAIFNISKENFLEYVKLIASFVCLKNKKVLDIGTGNGNLLLALSSMYSIEPYGTDISKPLLDVARRIMPHYAKNFKYGTLAGWQVDFCLMNSVTQYLAPFELKEIIENVNAPNVLLMDVVDKSVEQRFISDQADRLSMTVKERNEMYKNTPLYFYHKSYFLGLGYDVKFTEMPDFYPGSDIGGRYCVFIKKIM